MEVKRVGLELATLVLLSTAMLFIGINYYLVMFVDIILIIIFEADRKSKLEELGFTTKRIWPSIKVQMPFTILGVAGLMIYANLNGYSIRTPEPAFIAYWLISIPMQEFIFRGYMQRVFRALMSPLNTVLLASIIFSAVHYFSGIPEFWILMITTFGAGFAWGWAYEKERNITGPIFSHLLLGTLIFLILPANGI
jgi:membrane protease YdiL (CAAX protease family)